MRELNHPATGKAIRVPEENAARWVAAGWTEPAPRQSVATPVEDVGDGANTPEADPATTTHKATRSRTKKD